MPRKYAGPLQPGKRSAYVKGSRTRKTYTKSSRPSRFASAGSKKQSLVNRTVAKVMGKISENKVNEITRVIHGLPGPINSSITYTNPTYVAGYCTGNKPAGWSSGLVSGANQYLDLDGFTFPQGTGAAERIGDYMYAKRTTLQLNIMMLNNIDINRIASAYRFRLVLFRPKTRVRTPNNPADPTTDLFISTTGESFGHGTSTSVEFNDLWQGILNKKDYSILKDSKFMLNCPASQMSNDPGQVKRMVPLGGAVSKDFLFRIPYNKKLKFDNVSNRPEDLNQATGLLIFAQAVGDHKQNSEQFEVNLQGLTSFLDG